MEEKEFTIRNAASAAEVMVVCGVEEAMNKFN